MKRSKGKARRVRQRILIMCEGETEQRYFQAIKEEPTYKKALSAVSSKVLKAKHPTPEQVVAEALKRKDRAFREGNPYDEVWVIFDHDHHPNRQEAREHALAEGAVVGFSALAFEMWYLLHFEQTARGFTRSEDLLKALRKHLPQYEKARQNDFALLKPYLPTGYAHAAWLRDQKGEEERPVTDQPAWTDVDKLVRRLTEATT
jgi:hypothetical protein